MCIMALTNGNVWVENLEVEVDNTFSIEGELVGLQDGASKRLQMNPPASNTMIEIGMYK